MNVNHNVSAIIKLEKPFRLHNFRQTIPRMQDPQMLQNLIQSKKSPSLTVLGWGSLSEGGKSAKVLNYVNLPYIDQGTCRAAMNPYEVFDGMLCAGDIEKGKIDACQGDSGGPIVYRKVIRNNKSSTIKHFLFSLREMTGRFCSTLE